MKPHEEDLNHSHRLALLRVLGENRNLKIADIARDQCVSQQSVYNVIQGKIAGKIWLPKVVAKILEPTDGDAAAKAFSDISGAGEAGLIVAHAKLGNRDSDSIAHQALRLGGDLGAIHSLVHDAMKPDSPGGIRLVEDEKEPIRKAAQSLQRAAQSLLAQLNDESETA